MNNNVWALTIVTSSTQPSVHSQLVFVTFWVSLGKFMSRLLFSCCSVSSVSSWTARRSSDCRLFTTEPEVYKKEWAVSFIGRTRGHRALIQEDFRMIELKPSGETHGAAAWREDDTEEEDAEMKLEMTTHIINTNINTHIVLVLTVWEENIKLVLQG